jgi:hypothetical protein
VTGDLHSNIGNEPGPVFFTTTLESIVLRRGLLGQLGLRGCWALHAPPIVRL